MATVLLFFLMVARGFSVKILYTPVADVNGQHLCNFTHYGTNLRGYKTTLCIFEKHLDVLEPVCVETNPPHNDLYINVAPKALQQIRCINDTEVELPSPDWFLQCKPDTLFLGTRQMESVDPKCKELLDKVPAAAQPDSKDVSNPGIPNSGAEKQSSFAIKMLKHFKCW